MICYAYQDEAANREMRMLHELESENNRICFKEVYPEYTGVVIYECNAIENQALDNFVYYGFVRNQNYFFIKDYMNVPRTNLLHAIQNRSVYLCGDKYWCGKLEEYLKEYAHIEEIRNEDI